MEDKTMENSKIGDIRVKKTCRALYEAMIVLLGRRNFNSITINDLCSEALICRATFYTHFRDKYDLLRYFLCEVKDNIIKDVYKYAELERAVNGFISSNKKVIINVLKDANGETLALIREFMSSIADLAIKRRVTDETSPHRIILLNFFIGGLVNLLTWMAENNFPKEIRMINTYLYKMLEVMTVWDAEQEQSETAAYI